ncbi:MULTISPECIES: DNA polymerase IV [unclassified Pseudovibrio]|uniref:DNA polymerase IV n=1 Tax=unclassified Pseudovibrio TaxID=2627060 RepID=UPI0007AEDB60|nr:MULTISPECIES: DNA polymerase IV [unclassified Pseudovibrio]KZL00618.1 DNA polymerase IV [Pseudovibrio sp. W74]KZL06808.1 DNA polymerase IV [Pseudovibrio sp. Ad14]
MAPEATTPLKALCRDCTHRFRADLTRCPKCGSPRILAHAELDTLEIAHIDCDAFYASVEKRENPELADRPVIVGGGQRGVVSAACYIARIYGVRSAMPMFKALDACPDAVVIKPRMELYSQVGRQIREEMEKLTPLVEPLSIDEAFLDLSGTQKLHGATPAELLVQFVNKIQTELRLSVSVGLAPNKFLAKIASDLDKPRGFSVIGDAEKKEFLAKQPTSVIWGVGKVFQGKLERDGIKTIGQLQLKDPTDLARKYGAMGLRLAKLCQGEDDRHVSSNRGAKSISGETTFNTDVSDVTQLSKSLWALTEKVSYRTKKAEKSGRSVTLKLKTADFKTITRSRMLHDPTQLADKIFRTADDLLHNVADGKMRFRLIGVGIGDLGPADQADPEDLLDEQAEKRAKAERAMDALRGKFKDSSVVSLGRSIKAPSKR